MPTVGCSPQNGAFASSGMSAFIPLLLLLLLLPVSPSARRPLASFSAHGRVNNWLRVAKGADGSGGWLALGAVNRLYVLELDNLTLAHEAVTGPNLDSPFCNAELSSCVGPRDGIVDTDAWNKVLVPLRNTSTGLPDALLVCGSTRQGECHLRTFPTLERVTRHPALSGAWQHVPVAANAPEASTAALLVGDRLFVGAESSHEGSPYREAFPALTTRQLSDGLQPVRAGSLDGEAAVHVRAEFRARFHVRYLLSFRDPLFVYFLVVQPRSAHTAGTAQLVTRLVRVCTEDDRYASYSEIALECRSGEDNALFGVARAGVLDAHSSRLFAAFSDADGAKSAICAFPLAKLRLTFWYNIDRCRGGTDTIGLPHIGRDAKCTNRSAVPLSEDTCLLGVGGSLDASAPALVQFPGRVLTALDARPVDGHLLLAAGTQRGEVVQMEAPEGATALHVYADFRAAADPVEQIAILEDAKEEPRLLVAAEREVLLLSLSQCGGDQDRPSAAGVPGSCADCTSTGDPLCAWCLPLGRCTRPGRCAAQPSLLLRRCPRPAGLPVPRNVSLSAAGRAQLLLPLSGLPPTPTLSLECLFGTAFRSRARPHPKGVLCPLPKEMPRLQPGKDHADITLALRSGGSRAELLAGAEASRVTIYSCAEHQICSSCSASRWPCRWCAAERKCVDVEDLSAKCPRERNSSIGCVRILPGDELLVPDSAKNASLQLQLENLLGGLELACRLDGRQIPAVHMRDGRVRCESRLMNYAEPEPIHNATLELIADGQLVDATTVTIYKCALLAADCSRCVALDPRFACAWCESACHHADSCPHSPSGAVAADELCTAPAIHSFWPDSGPPEGGTLVEIRGRDLGSRLQDVRDRVRVGGVPCRIVQYEASERILCTTGTAPTETAGPVRVTIGPSGRRNVESARDQHFRYRSPQLRSVHPGFGPQSGGTRLELFGTHLNVGTNASVHLDNVECVLAERDNDRILCTTGPSTRAYTVTAVRLQIDAAVRLMPAKFEYRPDPVVRDVQPRTAYESGGRNLTVTGAHLDSALSPKLFLLSPPIVASASPDEMELVSELGACRVLNQTALRCESPRLALPTALLRQSSLARWSVGLAMDGVRQLRDLGPAIQLTTVPDPQFFPFAGVYSLRSDQPLMLSGQWLSQAADSVEYIVTIGTAACPVFLLEPDRLLCRPPLQQPASTDDVGTEMSDGRPLVVVRVGRIRVEIGPLEYSDGAAKAHFWDTRAIASILGALLIFCGVLAAVGWAWRRRQGEHERMYRRIQLQMEQMESQVRNECKQAFAELQTDVLAELDACVDEGAGIPFLERREFLARLLLRDSADPCVLAGYGAGGMGIYSSRLPMALAQFDSLLWNRQFLYVLVQMAEEDPTVSAAERSTLASLLLVALSRNMAFTADVVLSLLSAHIQKCVLNKSAHLLFRHSDSLVEKLFQHWLSLSLLPYLHDVQGPACPLFLLYRAIKSLTEKGPVDAVSGHARYSLSEQSLLRHSVDAQPITVLVIPLDGLFDQAPVSVRALSCDTVSQLKAKLLDTLYRNAPFCARLSAEQFDLEWRCPRRGSVLLLDDDQPQQRTGTRRLNTLACYALPQQALLAMQQRPPPAASYTFRSGGSVSEHSFTLLSGGGWRCSSANQLLSSSSDSSHSPTATANGGGATAVMPMQAEPAYAHLGATPTDTVETWNSAKKRKQERRAMLPEVYLTRLLMCKGTLQRFVDTFFETVLFSDAQPVPIVLKYVFDFLDVEAEQHQVEGDVLHAWKANCLVLRFWMQLVHNPDLLFDIPPRQPHIAGSLAVLGQTLVDMFSRTELALGKESPSSKLLFAREIARYRPRAGELFRRIAAQPCIAPPHFLDYAGSLSKMAGEGLSSTCALGELLNWVRANGLRLAECLEGDAEARKLRLGDRLRQIVHSSILEPEEEGACPKEENVYATLR